MKVALPTTKERERNLAQYIAASVALHANDGWSYLGRSVSCLLAGDTHRALHLAYYAELRASMSLLAGAGIGIFDKKHFIVPTTNSTANFGLGHSTHVIAWLALFDGRMPGRDAPWWALIFNRANQAIDNVLPSLAVAAIPAQSVGAAAAQRAARSAEHGDRRSAVPARGRSGAGSRAFAARGVGFARSRIHDASIVRQRRGHSTECPYACV